MKLAEEVFVLCENFPRHTAYNLRDQIQRAVLSIPSNIAEGLWRGTKAEIIRFSYIARGSAMELETQIILATRLKIISESDSDSILLQVEEILKMITGFISYYKNTNN